MDSPSTLDAGDNNEQIYHSAVNCGALFKQLLTQSAENNGRHYATLRDHHLRFERWVEFVGALADEQASLDDRLKPYPEVQGLVLQMLQMLDSNLRHVVRFQQKATTGAKPVDDTTGDRGRHKPQMEAHRTVEVLPAQGAPTTRMANDLSASLAIQAALKAVQEAIDRLQRLGTIIRRSSTVTIASRVKNYALKADATENDEFNRLILLRVKGILPGISESLAIQLLESISHRRLRLLYQRRHQRKLGRQRPDRSNQPLSREPEVESQKSDPPPQPVISKSGQRKAAGMASVYSKSQPDSGTAHSTFDLAAFQNYHSQEDSVPPDNITVTSVAQGYSYPRPPRPQDGSKHTRCEWCFEEITDSQLQEPGWWRSHFKKDLQPYVCISEDCMDPPMYFTSFLLWRKHMEQFHTADWARRIHSPSVSYCDLDPDEYQEFKSANELREHLTSRHTIAFTEAQLARKLARSVLPSPRKESICPLCNQDVSETHDPMIESKVEGKETLRFAKQPKKARFGDLADSLGSEDEASPRQPNHLVEPELGTDDTAAVRRQKVVIHVASHLKSLSFLSIRYMESDSESVKSEDAALGIENDASDQDRLSSIFPLSDGPLDFQDIPPDDRPVNDGGSGDQDASLDFFKFPPASLQDLSSSSHLADGWADTGDDAGPVHDLTASNVLRARVEITGPSRPLFLFDIEGQKWRYVVDNNFATDVLSSIPQVMIQPTASLCQICIGLDITKSEFSVEYALDYLRASSEVCNLCSLLLRTLDKFSEWAAIKDSTRKVLLCRDASVLRLGTNGPPLLSLCVDPRLPPSKLPPDIQVGFPMLYDSQSHERFEQLRRFLRNCDENHTCIPSHNGYSWMPTRLVDVENLRLVESNDIPKSEEIRRYMALSYLWGGSRAQMATTKANINHQLQSGLLLDHLSPTIRDAVAVTKHLGIQFLWVDSICIIQDDQEDWELESRLVSKVYRNAYCTIAATSAPSQADEFLKPRLPRDFVAINTPAKVTISLCELIDDFEREVDGAPLNQKAWVFQERLLSRRTIHFAHNQFYWQCGDGIRCETFTKLSHPLDVLFGDPDFPKECLRKIRPQFRVPQMLYELFSRLKLTRHADRHHAIAEIEGLLAVEPERIASYGVFSGYEMARGLLWKRADDEASLIPIYDGKSVPKWSWMAYVGAIAYLNVPADEGDIRWGKVRFGESNYPTKAPLLVHGHLVAPEQTIKAYYDTLNESDIRVMGKEERRIALATYEPEDGKYVREYILIVELVDDDRHGECWRRIGVGEFEHPKAMEAELESTFITLI